VARFGQERESWDIFLKTAVDVSPVVNLDGREEERDGDRRADGIHDAGTGVRLAGKVDRLTALRAKSRHV
jgi:hypothetical protein